MTHRQLIIVLGLIEREGKLLIMRRVDPNRPYWHHCWEIPGGKIDPGETPLHALHREIVEETGLTIHSQQLLGVHTHHWNTPGGVQQTFMIVYHCQPQPGEVVLNPEENDAYSWETVEEIIAKPKILDGTEAMLREFYDFSSNTTRRKVREIRCSDTCETA